MNYKILLLLLIVFGLASTNINLQAQDDEDLEIFDDSFWDSDFDTSFKIEHPVVEVMYGIAQPSIHEGAFSSNFNQVSDVVGKFGYVDIESNLFESNVYDYNLNYFFLGYSSPDLNLAKDQDLYKIGIKTWEFGVGSTEGYGHEFTDKTNLLFFTSWNLSWSGIEFDKNSLVTNEQDNKLMDRFADGIRFNEKSDGGIKFQVYKPFAITANYQRHIVYPRLLFWKWAGSGILTGIGDGIISHFSEDIVKASPIFGPFFYFALKTAYNYGAYELRKKRMNWPFVSETPLMHEGFNVGLTFTF